MKRIIPLVSAVGYLIVFGFIVVIFFVSFFKMVAHDVSSETQVVTMVASTDID